MAVKDSGGGSQQDTQQSTGTGDGSGGAATGVKIDQAALDRQRSAGTDATLDTKREVDPWDRDDAPKGSTSESLLTTDENGRRRVAGATHYMHLADGRIVAGYSGGTHYTEPGEGNNPDKVTAIVSHYEG